MYPAKGPSKVSGDPACSVHNAVNYLLVEPLQESTKVSIETFCHQLPLIKLVYEILLVDGFINGSGSFFRQLACPATLNVDEGSEGNEKDGSCHCGGGQHTVQGKDLSLVRHGGDDKVVEPVGRDG